MGLKEKLKQIETLESKLASVKKSVSKEIMGDLKQIMIDNPLLEGIRWTQYTPHFNDGEPCVFEVNDLSVRFDESVQPRIEDHYDDNFIITGPYGEIDDEFFKEKSDIFNFKEIKTLQKATKEVELLFEKLRDSTNMAEQFGDGVQVTVTKSGVEVEDYDHD